MLLLETCHEVFSYEKWCNVRVLIKTLRGYDTQCIPPKSDAGYCTVSTVQLKKKGRKKADLVAVWSVARHVLTSAIFLIRHPWY